MIKQTLTYIRTTGIIYAVGCTCYITYNLGYALNERFGDDLPIKPKAIKSEPLTEFEGDNEPDYYFEIKEPKPALRKLRKEVGNAEYLPEELPFKRK